MTQAEPAVLALHLTYNHQRIAENTFSSLYSDYKSTLPLICVNTTA